MTTMAIRINRYLSESGFCSRRDADGYVSTQLVTINGDVAELNSKVTAGDVVCVEGERVMPRRAVNFTSNSTPQRTVKKKVETERIDKVPAWLVKLREKHSELTPEHAKPKPREEREERPKRVKKKNGHKNHTRKKSFN